MGSRDGEPTQKLTTWSSEVKGASLVSTHTRVCNVRTVQLKSFSGSIWMLVWKDLVLVTWSVHSLKGSTY